MFTKYLVIILFYTTLVGFLKGRVFNNNSENQIIDLFDKNRNALVSVWKDREKLELKNLSTGFFIDNYGHVITSNLNFGKPGNFTIIFNKRIFECKWIGFDSVTGLCLLKVLKLPEKFAFIKVFPETKIPKTGSFILAITQKLSLPPSPRVSTVMGNMPYLFPFFRVELKLIFGERGSPVFDLHGSFVGFINKQISELEESLILPSFAVDRIIRDLKVDGRVNYGWIGLNISSKHDSKIYIKSIFPDSPLTGKDVKEDDIILSIGDFEIKNYRDYRMALFYARPDTKLKVVLERGLETKSFLINVKLKPNLLETQQDSIRNNKHKSSKKSPAKN